MSSLGQKIVSATKWSLITQLISKLIQPITTLILAHILAPEIFGAISLITMIISLGDLFSDAGFQKYLIQHEYENEAGLSLSANVAFWSNLSVSIFIALLISMFSDEIAILLGNDSIGSAIAISSISLPLTALISVQTGLYQRRLDFKTLFYSKTASSLLILLVSVPLALCEFGYWSFVFGTLASNVFLAIWLTAQSDWHPKKSYSFVELRRMLSFSVWSLLENGLLWATSWAGTAIIGILMDPHSLGLFNTTITIVNGILSIATSVVKPVAYSGLSRLQNNRDEFAQSYLKIQKCLGLIVIPLSFSLLIFSPMIVDIFLGSAWSDASLLFGCYSFACAFTVVVGHISSEAYRAYGLPKVSLYTQLACFVFVVIGIFVGAVNNFTILSISLPISRLIGYLLVHSIACKACLHISLRQTVENLVWIYLVSIFIAVFTICILFTFNPSYFIQVILILIDVIMYLVLVGLIQDTRKTLFEILDRFGLSKTFDSIRNRKY